MSLPTFEQEQDITFTSDKPKDSIHTRKAVKVDKYTCEICKKKGIKKHTFEKKSAYTNHSKKHEKPLQDMYELDYLIYETNQPRKIWDDKRESYVTGFQLPDGYALKRIINLQKGVFHPVSNKAMTYSILLLERIK